MAAASINDSLPSAPPLTTYYFAHTFTAIPTFSPPTQTSRSTTTVTITSLYRLAPGTYTATLTFPNPLVASAFATATSTFALEYTSNTPSSRASPAPTTSDVSSPGGMGGQHTATPSTPPTAGSPTSASIVYTPPPTHHPNAGDSKHGRAATSPTLGRGQVAGISVAAVVALHLLLAGVVLLLLRRRRQMRRESNWKQSNDAGMEVSQPPRMELQGTGFVEMGEGGVHEMGGSVRPGCDDASTRDADVVDREVGSMRTAGERQTGEGGSERMGEGTPVLVAGPSPLERGSVLVSSRARPSTRRSEREPRAASEERPATRSSNPGVHESIRRRRSAPWVTRWD